MAVNPEPVAGKLAEHPVPPVGLATKVGLALTALLGAAGAVTAFIDGDHTPETIALIATAVASAISVILGRSQQAAAIYGARAATGQRLEQPVDIPAVERIPGV